MTPSGHHAMKLRKLTQKRKKQREKEPKKYALRRVGGEMLFGSLAVNSLMGQV